MEVHHPHTERKKFIHYLWEFLMLFLAVFCGFLAENFREHQVEHKREKQFMVSMVNELEADTSQMNYVLQDTVRPRGIDTLVNIIYAGNINTINTRMVYYLRRKYTFSLRAVSFARNTLTQLKNGGNMRLIRNHSVVDSLNKLDNSISRAESQFNFVSESYHSLASFESGIFNDGFYRENGKRMGEEFILNTKIQPVFLTKDYAALIDYANQVGSWAGYTKNYQRMIRYINEYSARLISYLKKEYHLK